MLKLWQEFLDRPDDRDIWDIYFKMVWYGMSNTWLLSSTLFNIIIIIIITILYQLYFAVFKIRIIKRSVWLLPIYNSVFILSQQLLELVFQSF